MYERKEGETGAASGANSKGKVMLGTEQVPETGPAGSRLERPLELVGRIRVGESARKMTCSHSAMLCSACVPPTPALLLAGLAGAGDSPVA